MLEWSLILACVAGVASWFTFRRVVVGDWRKWFCLALLGVTPFAPAQFIGGKAWEVNIDVSNLSRALYFASLESRNASVTTHAITGTSGNVRYIVPGARGTIKFYNLAGTVIQTFYLELGRDGAEMSMRVEADPALPAGSVRAWVGPFAQPFVGGWGGYSDSSALVAPRVVYSAAGGQEGWVFQVYRLPTEFEDISQEASGPTTEPTTRPTDFEEEELEIDPLKWTAEMLRGWADDLTENVATGSTDDPVKELYPFVQISEELEDKWEATEGQSGITVAWQYLTGTMEVYPAWTVGGIYIPAYDWINNALPWINSMLSHNSIVFAFNLLRPLLVLLIVFGAVRFHLRMFAYTFRIIQPVQQVSL